MDPQYRYGTISPFLLCRYMVYSARLNTSIPVLCLPSYPLQYILFAVVVKYVKLHYFRLDIRFLLLSKPEKLYPYPHIGLTGTGPDINFICLKDKCTFICIQLIFLKISLVFISSFAAPAPCSVPVCTGTGINYQVHS
jgi:hypothetical protein